MKSKLTDGAISELKCAAILLEYGWAVAFPFTHENPWDLLSDAENTFTVIKHNFDMYDEVDFIVLHDRIHQNWFVFTKGELNKRRTITLNPNKHTQQLNNWRRIQ